MFSIKVSIAECRPEIRGLSPWFSFFLLPITPSVWIAAQLCIEKTQLKNILLRKYHHNNLPNDYSKETLPTYMSNNNSNQNCWKHHGEIVENNLIGSYKLSEWTICVFVCVSVRLFYVLYNYVGFNLWKQNWPRCLVEISLTQKPSAQLPKAIHLYAIAEKTKMI